MSSSNEIALAQLREEITTCRKCPRLVAWREQIATEKRASFRDDVYWGKPVAGFGDANAELIVVGLAPAAHGANRTGRMFTGDRSGEWLYRALFDAGFANQPTSKSADDGLSLKNCYVTATVRCAPPDNKPSTVERNNCAPYLEREIEFLGNCKVIVALGAFAFDAVPRLFEFSPRPKFSHGARVKQQGQTLQQGLTLLGSYHPSQQNTFTGRLTQPAFDAIFVEASRLLAQS